MAPVMYDKPIMFEGNLYTVTQTWNGPQIEVSVVPENDNLKNLIVTCIHKYGQITLLHKSGYFEIANPVVS